MTASSRVIVGIIVGTSALAFAAACGTTTPGSGATAAVSAPDPRNATYRIDKATVTLANGRAERETAPGSSAKAVTTLSDVRTTGDVDGDGRPDAVVILVDQPGGSASFYYVAVLLNPTGGVVVTPAALLGDRIAVSGVKVDGKNVVVDILDRASGQPMTATPNVSVTKRFVVDAGALKAQ